MLEAASVRDASTTAGDAAAAELRQFSIVKTGPFWRVLQLCGLGDAHLIRSGVVIGVIAWIPLVVLSALQGVLMNGPTISFAESLGTHARLLLAVPLMFVAEVWFDWRSRAVAKELVRAGVVPAADLPRFARTLRRAEVLVGSPIVEMALVILTGIFLVSGVRTDLPSSVSTWRSVTGGPGSLTWAGWWYAMICMPLFQFLVCRWGWRLLVWGWVLWKMARLDLQLVPIHPDLAGGLGGLGTTQVSLSPLLFGLSGMLVASFAEKVLFAGVRVESLVLALSAVVVLAVLIAVAPLVFFAPRLLVVRERGLLEYGALASAYTQAFARKWLEQNPARDDLLGTADIQSLADLSNSFGVVRTMRIVPCSWRDILLLALASVLPMTPLSLTVLPLSELIVRAVRTILGI